MITLRGRELRRRGRHPRSAGRDRGARRRDRRRPVRAEPDDLAEALAAAVLAPRWLTTVSARQRRRRAEARPAAGEAATRAPPTTRRRTRSSTRAGGRSASPAQKPEKTSIVRLEWYVPAERWADAAGGAASPRSPAAARRRCRPATATSSRCSSATTRAARGVLRLRARRLDVLVLVAPVVRRPRRSRRHGPGSSASTSTGACSTADPRWREAVAGLFAAAAAALGAFYAEGWVEPAGTCRATTASRSPPGARRARPRSAATAGRGCPPSPRG